MSDPNGFFDRMPDGGIIDEVQRVPELLSHIQVIVDKKKKNGLFILSSSHQFLLMKNITQTLAGRTALLHLLPLSLKEIAVSSESNPDFDFFLKKGFYPKIHAEKINETRFYASYYETYVEKDVRELIHIKDISLFRKFIALCAGRIGQLLNKDGLSRDVGVSAATIEHWLSVLEASFILFRLQPYFENVGKRLIKSPKLYFYDVGLACFLLGIEYEKQLQTHYLRGGLFENMQIVEAIKFRWNQGQHHRLSFYRDSNGTEVDLVFESAGEVYLTEIKSAKTYLPEFTSGIENFNKVKKSVHNMVVYGGNEFERRTKFNLVPWHGLQTEFQKWQDEISG